MPCGTLGQQYHYLAAPLDAKMDLKISKSDSTPDTVTRHPSVPWHSAPVENHCARLCVKLYKLLLMLAEVKRLQDPKLCTKDTKDFLFSAENYDLTVIHRVLKKSLK